MKKHVINFHRIFSYFREWLKEKETPQTVESLSHFAPITTPKEVLYLCCNIVRKKEIYVRAQAKRLNPLTIQNITEPDAPDGYKGLRIETKEYALWCELFDRARKPQKGKGLVCCRAVLLYFYCNTKVEAFLKELRKQEHFQCIWDHCWLSLEEEHVKITLKTAQNPRLPHCLIFQTWNKKRR